MMKIIFKIAALFFVLSTGFITKVSGQDNYPISLQVQLAPPYPAYISDYKYKPIISFTNHGRLALDVYIRGRLHNDRGQYIQTAPNIFSNIPIHVPGYQTVVVQGSQLDENYLNLNNLQTNLDDESYRNLFQLGMIPEGFYTFCIYAYARNANGNYISVSNPKDPGGCFAYNVGYVTPPHILSPMPDGKILPSPNQNINISWTRPVGNMQGASVVYDLYLVKVLSGQDPHISLNNAVQYGAGLFLKRANIPINNFQFTNLTTFHLDEGSQYALMVQARDLTGKTAFENNGRSQVRIFQYGEKQKKAVAVSEKLPIVEQGNCSCAVDIASLDQTNNNASLKAGGSFSMASLKVKIGSLNNNGAKVSGDGTILMNNVPVQVIFSDVVVNKDGIAIAGRAAAKKAGGFNFLTNGGSPSVSTANYNTFINRIKNYNLDAVKNGGGFMLPFGLHAAGAPDGVNAAVVSMNITPAKATYNAIAAVQLADANSVLSLLAKDVCFSNATCMCGDALFVLAKDFNVPNINLTFKGYQSKTRPGTYVLYSKNELKEFHIHAEYNFPTNLITKVDGTPAKAILDANAASWSDWTAYVTIDPFTTTLEALVYTINDGAFYDHSTLKNPAGMPASFADAALADKNPEIGNAIWTGFFIPKISVALPSILKNTRRPDNKLQIAATNLILDDGGLTGVIAAKNIVSIRDGSVGGWYCSVDEINIKLLNSSFKEGGLYGQVILPFSDKNNASSRIDYSSTLSTAKNGGDVKYQFIAKQKNDIDFSAWWAHINLNNTAIEVTNNTETGNTVASAALSGKLNIEGNIEGYKIGLDLIKVENLVVQTEEPYVRVGNVSAGFAFSSPQHSLAGFPVSITNIHPKVNGSTAELQFDLGLTLSDINSKLLPDATTTFTLSANVLGGDRPVWKRMDFVPDKITVSGNLAGIVHIDKGEIDFMRDDPTYGNSIRGLLKASFAGLPGASVECHAMFGNKSGNNYWYFDAYGTLPEPVPIGPGISLQGLGGGAYYNLAPTVLDNMDAKDYFANRDKYRLDQYKPQSGSFGMKFMVGISSSDGALFAGIGTLETTFNTNRGFSLQALKGEADIELFKAPGSEALKVDDKAPVKAHVGWMLGITDKIFSLQAQVVINYLPELPVLEGDGTFALLADAKNQNYFIKIGEPFPYDKRINLEMSDPLHILNLKLNAYFMAGNKINSSIPEPDPAIVHVGELPGYQKVQMSAKGGVVMGASASFDYDLRFLVFFFEANGGIGFDVALQSDVHCSDGREAKGFNGWYAAGQAYAGLEGAFGLYVDMFFCHDCKLEALRLRADILIRAGLPDPAWFEGYANTHYEVLNGLIEGNIGFKLSIGSVCKVNQSAFQLPLVQEVKPTNGKTEVPLNAYPEFVFNYPIGIPFELIDPNLHRPWRFRIDIEDVSVINTDDNAVYADYRNKDSHPVFDDNHHNLTLMTIDAFKGQTNYRMHVKVQAMKSKMTIEPGSMKAHYTNDWFPVKDKNGQPVIGDSTSTFKTGACKPDQIISDPRNRLGAYPFPNQRYFLQGESKRGAIILDRAYGCLRNINEKYRLFARFTPVKGGKELPSVESPITEGGGQYLYFDIPKLPNETIIRVEIIKRTQFSKFDDFVVYNFSPALSARLNRAIQKEGKGSNTMKVGSQYYQTFDDRKNLAHMNKSFNTSNHKATLGNKNLDIVLYSYHFKTSRFNTLADKLAGAHFDKVLYHFGGAGSQLKVAERFDTYDVKGFISDNYINKEILFYTMPLVVLKESNDLNKWMKEQVVPLVYKKFDDANIELDKARIEKGLKPSELQLEGIGCTVSYGRFCVPQRPVFIENFDPPLTAKEINAAEPVYFHGINISGFKVVGRSQMIPAATNFNQIKK